MPLNLKNKTKLFLAIMLTILIGLFAFNVFAEQNNQLEITTSMEPKLIEKAGVNASVNISIKNTGQEAIKLAVFDPSGAKIKDIAGSNDEGDIEIQASQTITVEDKLNISQKNLNDGSLKYFLKIIKSEEKDVLKFIEVKLDSKEKIESNEVGFERSINSTILTKGQDLVVEYTVTNNTDSPISNLKIIEHKSIAKKPLVLKSLAPGESHVFTFTKKMDRKNLTSSATLNYNKGKKKLSKKVDSKNISYGEANLIATLQASSTGVIVGEPVTLKLSLKNKGNLSYSNLKAEDSNLGEIFSNINVEPNTTSQLETTINVNENTSYQLKITGMDSSGQEVNITTKKVEIKTMLESEKLEFDVVATPDRETVFGDNGKVRFTIGVTNRSLSDAKNVNIYSRDTKIFTIDTIEAGKTKYFTRDFSISMSGNYNFTLKTINSIGEEVSFNSNESYIQLSSPTMVPVIITPSPLPPLVTIPPKSWDDAPKHFEKTGKLLNTFAIIFAVLTSICIILIIAALVFRLIAKINSSKAVARITEVAQERDYKKPHEISPEDEEEGWKKDTFSDILNDKLDDSYVSPYADLSQENSDANISEDSIQEKEDKNKLMHSFRRPSPSERK